MQDYLACIESVDESVGKVLDFLKAEGLEKDTIVVYSSDQGFYLGEHGWFDKRWIFEESLRTPLLVRWPGVTKAGSTNANLVSNVDFAETFLAAAGQSVPAEMHGKSLVPLLRGPGEGGECAGGGGEVGGRQGGADGGGYFTDRRGGPRGGHWGPLPPVHRARRVGGRVRRVGQAHRRLRPLPRPARREGRNPC